MNYKHIDAVKHKHIIRAYGTNVAKSIDQLIEEKDQEPKIIVEAKANSIVDAMTIIASKGKKVTEEIKIQAWQHFLELTDYSLDINVPYNIERKYYKTIPDKVPIIKNDKPVYYLGKHIPEIVERIANIPDEQNKLYLLQHLLKLMVTIAQHQNKTKVTPDIVLEEIKKLYPGKFPFSDEEVMSLQQSYKKYNQTHKSRSKKSNGKKRSKKYYSYSKSKRNK